MRAHTLGAWPHARFDGRPPAACDYGTRLKLSRFVAAPITHPLITTPHSGSNHGSQSPNVGPMPFEEP